MEGVESASLNRAHMWLHTQLCGPSSQVLALGKELDTCRAEVKTLGQVSILLVSAARFVAPWAPFF